MLIEFKSYGSQSIHIESKRIVGVKSKNSESTYIFVACGETTEDWLVQENVDAVISKIPFA